MMSTDEVHAEVSVPKLETAQQRLSGLEEWQRAAWLPAAALTKLEQIVHIHGAIAVEVLAVDASGAELADCAAPSFRNGGVAA